MGNKNYTIGVKDAEKYLTAKDRADLKRMVHDIELGRKTDNMRSEIVASRTEDNDAEKK